MTFKPGDKIRLTKDCGLMKKGEIYEVHDGDRLREDTGTLYAWGEGNSTGCAGTDHWQLVEKTWETLEQGDRLKKEGYDDLIVQGTMGEIVFFVYDDEARTPGRDSITGLQDTGYEISTPSTSTIEMTVAEAEKKMKLEAGTLRIKD
jgi:hypothetical protein